MMVRQALRSVGLVALTWVPVSGLEAQVPGELRGRVTDARTATPIVEARVEVVGWPAFTYSNADGTFVVRGLDSRDYRVRVRAVGYPPREVAVSIANGRTATIEVALEPAPAILNPLVVSGVRDADPESAVVYDRAAIESAGRRDVGELLRATPGVVITQAGGPGSPTRVSIRGSGSGEVLVLVDGVPLNSTISGDADLSQISLESVERVTVRTGAQSARYGGRALAGVIEIETRRSVAEVSALIRAGAWGEHGASASIGTNQRVGGGERLTESLSGEYRRILGDFPYELPDLRGGGTARRLNSDATSGSLLGGFGIEDDGGSIRARGFWWDLSRGLAGSIIQPSLTGRQRSSRLGGGIEAHRGRGRWSGTAILDVTRERATFIDPTPPFGTAFDDTVTATGVTAIVTGNATFDLGVASIGGEARTLDVESTMLAPGAPHWQRLLGGFGSVRLSRSVGATTVTGDAGARIDGSSLVDGSTISARASASASHGGLTISLSLGSGYAPPTLADQFFHEGVLVRANPSLRPERTRGDLEGRVTLHDVSIGRVALSGTAAAYRSNIDGMILWFPDFRFIWSPFNFDVHRSGWEVSGRAALPAPDIDLQGTLNSTAVVYTGAVLSGQVAYRPRTTGSATAGVGSRAGRFELAVRYVGDRRTVSGSALNSLDPYWLTDVRWTRSVPVGPWRLDLSAGLENLFDRPAAMLVDYPFPGRTWTMSIRARH